MPGHAADNGPGHARLEEQLVVHAVGGIDRLPHRRRPQGRLARVVGVHEGLLGTAVKPAVRKVQLSLLSLW